jgi:hypothetical protein
MHNCAQSQGCGGWNARGVEESGITFSAGFGGGDQLCRMHLLRW